MKLLVLIFSFFILQNANASSWDECIYKGLVTEVTPNNFIIKKVSFVRGSGMGGSPGRFNCLEYLKNKQIPTEKVVGGKHLIQNNQMVYLTRRNVSAMGPAGVVHSVSFKLSLKVEKQKK